MLNFDKLGIDKKVLSEGLDLDRKISPEVSESLSEYLVLTGWISTRADGVSLVSRLGESDIVLQYPYMTARMQSVVGPEMAVAAGRQGILTCIPRSLRDEDKQAIIDANNAARLREGEIEYLENPVRTEIEGNTFGHLEDLVKRTGHSVIPIMDRFSKLEGFYIHDPNKPVSVPSSTPVKELIDNKDIKNIITRLKTDINLDGIPFLYEGDEGNIKEVLKSSPRGFIPIVDRGMILKRLAFLSRFDTNFLAMAISTASEKKWVDDIEKWVPQIDSPMIDSSNACFDDSIRALRYGKKRFPNKPFGVGNITQGKHFIIFAEERADYIIGGMGIGSICETGITRGNGRGQFTVAKDLYIARREYYKRMGRYVPFVLDGGIKDIKDMTVALSFADFIMMGNYFNRFYEAAARKLRENKRDLTHDEKEARFAESWGEGHPVARLVATYGINFREVLKLDESVDISTVLERYGHTSLSSATVEGVFALVELRGRLKPCVEEGAKYVKATISNTGASNLDEYRKISRVEKMSHLTLKDMYPHDVLEAITEKFE